MRLRISPARGHKIGLGLEVEDVADVDGEEGGVGAAVEVAEGLLVGLVETFTGGVDV